MKRLLFLLFLLTGEAFGAIRTVQTTGVSGPGSFSQVLMEAVSGDTILFNVADGSLSPVVILPPSLSSNTKDLLIEGNGVTLSGGTIRSRTFSNEAGAKVVFRRTHFTNGYLINKGQLKLESCIFSSNRSPDGKGAVWNDNGKLIVRGCTFFENVSTHCGAAIYTEGSSAEASFMGCLFLHNVSEKGASVYRASGKISSEGHNIFDYDIFAESDKFYHEEDIHLPAYNSYEPAYWFSPISFRIMQNDYMYFLSRIVLPVEDYPETDFYGAPIQALTNGKAFSGAVQSVVRSQNGYVLHYVIQGNNHLTVETVIGEPPDEDGLFLPGTTVLLKDETPDAVALSWTVNEVTRPPASLSEGVEIYMNGHQRVKLTVYRQRLVTQSNDDGEGSLRQVLTSMQDYDVIQFADGLKGKTIFLNSKLPTVTNRFIRIEGIELTLAGNDYPLLTFHGASACLRGIRFTTQEDVSYDRNGGIGEGGIVFNKGGDLTLHSCIFSGNELSKQGGDGGALHNAGGKMIVSACTFYNNTAFRGGAIYNAGELELQGNIFSGNRTVIPSNGQTLFNTGTVTAGHNFYDADSYGFSFGAGNEKISAILPFSPVTFELTSNNPALVEFSPPSLYPETDYYGETFETVVYPGAVKQNHPEGFILSWETFGQGQIELIEGPMPTVARKLVSAGSVVTLRATPIGAGDARVIYWEVNGQQRPETGDLTLTVNGNTSVRAVFKRIYTVTTLTDDPNGGQGTFRNYLFTGWQEDGDVIRFADDLAGETFVLTTGLPEITHKITIEGNGVTFDGSNLTSPMFNVNPEAEVNFSRIRFTGCILPSTSESPGGAVFFNQGQLLLSNCIFDNNHTDDFSGGAIYSTGLLLATACTFYGNSAQTGGAICVAGGASLTAGNVFCNNTAQTAVDIYESVSLKNIHRYDQYLIESIIDPVTYVPYNGDRLQVSYEELSSFGFPVVDFYNVSRNTRTTTSTGATVLTTFVSFDTHDEGATTVPSRIVERGSFLNEPSPEVQRPEYLFEGWFEDSGGTYRWNFDLRPTSTESLVLHAKWQSLYTAYAVTFRLGNGQADLLSYVFPSTGILECPEDPSRPYYTFLGWFANEDCTLPWDFQTLIVSNTTIYAGWIPVSFLVTFDPRNGSLPITSTTSYGDVLVPPTIIPVGVSVVIGWCADTLSAALWNFETTQVISDTTLYAVWSPPLKSISVLLPVISLTPTVFTEFVRLQGAGGRQLGIYNSSGRLLSFRKLETDDEIVNTSAFSPGIYFFSLSALSGKERSLLLKAIRH
ncbi:MAG: InlB B-repeat-containing protein [Tannerellaceae bacterium]|jgi:predicted outer membrane repeat protein|nr:InlB B-repeat-containing protein [Tannerellaceae bacterium]